MVPANIERIAGQNRKGLVVHPMGRRLDRDCPVHQTGTPIMLTTVTVWWSTQLS
jgi:hypothetical protein